MASEGSRNVNSIVVARYTGISVVASRDSDEKFDFRVKRNSIVEVDRLFDTGALALEIVNYGVSVALTGNDWTDATCITSVVGDSTSICPRVATGL